MPQGQKPSQLDRLVAEESDRILDEEADRQNVPRQFVRKIAKIESSGAPDVISGQRRSSAGAIGKMQLMPRTARDLKVDPYDIEQNIQGGVRYAGKQLRDFGSEQLGAAAYNSGPGNVRRAGNRVPNIPETQKYSRQFPSGQESSLDKLVNELGGIDSDIEPTPKPSPRPSRQPAITPRIQTRGPVLPKPQTDAFNLQQPTGFQQAAENVARQSQGLQTRPPTAEEKEFQSRGALGRVGYDIKTGYRKFQGGLADQFNQLSDVVGSAVTGDFAPLQEQAEGIGRGLVKLAGAYTDPTGRAAASQNQPIADLQARQARRRAGDLSWVGAQESAAADERRAQASPTLTGKVIRGGTQGALGTAQILGTASLGGVPAAVGSTAALQDYTRPEEAAANIAGTILPIKAGQAISPLAAQAASRFARPLAQGVVRRGVEGAAGGATNAAQYAATQAALGRPIDPEEAIVQAVTGAGLGAALTPKLPPPAVRARQFTGDAATEQPQTFGGFRYDENGNPIRPEPVTGVPLDEQGQPIQQPPVFRGRAPREVRGRAAKLESGRTPELTDAPDRMRERVYAGPGRRRVVQERIAARGSRPPREETAPLTEPLTEPLTSQLRAITPESLRTPETQPMPPVPNAPETSVLQPEAPPVLSKREQARVERGRQVVSARDDAESARLRATDLEERGDFDGARRARIDELNALRAMRKRITPDTRGGRTRLRELGLQMEEAQGKIGDLKRRGKEAARIRQEAEKVPTSELPPRTAPDTRQRLAESNPLLKSEVNPEGGVPIAKSAPVDFSRLAERQDRGSGEPLDNARLIGRIRSLGGIDPGGVYTGELQSAVDKKYPGLINRKGGIRPDTLIEYLAEDGYPVDRNDLDSLFRAIDQDIAGKPVYPLTRADNESYSQDLSDYYENRPPTAEFPESRRPSEPLPDQQVTRETGRKTPFTSTPTEPPAAAQPEPSTRFEAQSEAMPRPSGARSVGSFAEELKGQSPSQDLDLQAFERVLKRNATENPRPEGEQTRPGQPAPISLSEYSDIVTNNRDAVNRLAEMNVNSPEAEPLVQQIRDYANKNRFDPYHVDTLLNAIRNDQLQRAQGEDFATSEPNQPTAGLRPDDVRLRPPTESLTKTVSESPQITARQIDKPVKTIVKGSAPLDLPAEQGPTVEEVRARRQAEIAQMSPDELERAGDEADAKLAQAIKTGTEADIRAARSEVGDLNARRRQLVREKRLPSRAKRAQMEKEAKEATSVRNPLDQDVTQIPDDALPKRINDAERILNNPGLDSRRKGKVEEFLRRAREEQARRSPETPQVLEHKNPDINGKEVIGRTASGKLIVPNENNKGGISVVNPPESPGTRSRDLPEPVSVKRSSTLGGLLGKLGKLSKESIPPKQEAGTPIDQAIEAAREIDPGLRTDSGKPLVQLLDDLQRIDVKVFDAISGDERARAGLHNEYLRTLTNTAHDIQRNIERGMSEYSLKRRLEELEEVKKKIIDGAAKLRQLGRTEAADFYAQHGPALVDAVAAEARAAAEPGPVASRERSIKKRPAQFAASPSIHRAEREQNRSEFLKGSQVQDIVYHGTTKDFDAFSPDYDIAQMGIHVGTPKATEFFAAREGGRVLPLNASIKNPLELPDIFPINRPETLLSELQNKYDPKTYEESFPREELQSFYGRIRAKEDPRAILKDIQSYLKKKGYDGIKYKNEANEQEDFGSTSYAVFDPKQLKSATGNRGTFDPNQESILASTRKPVFDTPRIEKRPETIEEGNQLVESVRGEFRQRKGEAGTLLTNHQGTIVMASAAKQMGVRIGSAKEFQGAVFDVDNANKIADFLEFAADSHGKSGQKLVDLAGQIREAVDDAKANGKGSIVIADITGDPTLRGQKQLLREERFHQFQKSEGLYGRETATKINDALVGDRAYRQIKVHLRRREKYTNNPAVLISEASAKIASGQSAEYGLTEQQGLDFYKKYLYEASKIVGPEFLKTTAPGTAAAREAQASVKAETEARPGGRMGRGEPAANVGRGEGIPTPLSVGRNVPGRGQGGSGQGTGSQVRGTQSTTGQLRAIGTRIPLGARSGRPTPAAQPSSPQASQRQGSQITAASLKPVQGGGTGQPPAPPSGNAPQAPSNAPNQPAGFWSKASDLRKAGLLTSPKTHITNVLSNLFFQGTEELSRIPAGIADLAISAVTKRRSVAGANPLAVGRSTYKAATDGIRDAKQIMKTGLTAQQAQQLQVAQNKFTNPILRKYTDFVFNSLGAEDQVFKTYALNRSLEAQAKVQATNDARAGKISRSDIRQWTEHYRNNPTNEMSAQAITDAEVATFQNDNKLSGAVRAVRGQMGEFGNFALDMVLPFDRTPTNIIARTLEMTPLGFGKNAAQIGRAIGQKAFTQEQQRQFVQTFGRATTGSALILLGYSLAQKGLMTGLPETDAKERSKDLAREPYAAIKGGDRWYQVGKFSPVGSLMAIGATLHRESTQKLKDESSRPYKVAAGLGQVALEQPLLKASKDIIEDFTAPQTVPAKAGRMLGSFVPSIVSDVGGLTDQYQRQGKTFTEAAQTRIPALRNRLPIRKNAAGQPMKTEWTDAIDPFGSQPVSQSGTTLERSTMDLDMSIGEPRRKPGEPDRLYEARKERAGNWFTQYGERLVNSSEFKSAKPEDQRKAMENLRRAIGSQSNLRSPSLRSFDPSRIMRGTHDSEQQSIRRRRGMIYVEPES